MFVLVNIFCIQTVGIQNRQRGRNIDVDGKIRLSHIMPFFLSHQSVIKQYHEMEILWLFWRVPEEQAFTKQSKERRFKKKEIKKNKKMTY